MQAIIYRSLPYKGSGNAWAVIIDGHTIGTVRRERVAFDGYMAHLPNDSIALLGEDGYAAEFTSRDEAAVALQIIAAGEGL